MVYPSRPVYLFIFSRGQKFAFAFVPDMFLILGFTQFPLYHAHVSKLLVSLGPHGSPVFIKNWKWINWGTYDCLLTALRPPNWTLGLTTFRPPRLITWKWKLGKLRNRSGPKYWSLFEFPFSNCILDKWWSCWIFATFARRSLRQVDGSCRGTHHRAWNPKFPDPTP